MQKTKSQEALLREMLDSVLPKEEQEESTGDVGQKAAERALDTYDAARREILKRAKKNVAN